MNPNTKSIDPLLIKPKPDDGISGFTGDQHQPVDEVLAKSKSTFDKQRVDALSRLTRPAEPKKTAEQKREGRRGLAVLAATVVSLAGLGIVAADRSSTSDTPETPAGVVGEATTTVVSIEQPVEVGSVEAFQQAQAVLDPTNPDQAARQQAEAVAKELLGPQE